MEKKTIMKIIEVPEECFVADDGTMFASREACVSYELSHRPEEHRSKRVQFLIKPSVNDALEKLVQRGVIRSKNDLVNYLLENFVAGNVV